MKNIWKWSAALIGLLVVGRTALSSQQFNLQSMLSLYLDALSSAFGQMSKTQLQHASQIIKSFDIYGDRDFRKLSYILATAWHESRRLTALKEIRCNLGTPCYEDQNRYWASGYWGRGFVHLTHLENYKKMSKRLNVDLVNNPALAENPVVAADILVTGMMEGIFTGLKLSDFINNQTTDYTSSRRVVNSLDRADLIAFYAHSINKSLRYQLA